jgi:ankyrin repeat protein
VNKREDADQHLPLHHAVLYGTLPMVKALGNNLVHQYFILSNGRTAVYV